MEFSRRRTHLAKMTETELESHFWQLAQDVVEPMVTLAQTHTSPSIERSVLLRMGFSSLEASAIVQKVFAHGLLGKGAGHVVYRYAKERDLDLLDAGRILAAHEEWDDVKAMMKRGGGADGDE